MNRVKKICTISLLLLSFFMGGDGIAQLAIGQWRDHLSYKKGISVAQSPTMVYCATESGIFRLEKYDYSIDRLSKISGLSDVGVNSVRFNSYDNTLLIAYENANIDLVKEEGGIYNISDIKRKLITAKKTINNIHFRNELAYLACGFGIVVLDMDRSEIKDTYYIGVNSGYINIRDITSDANYLYAATDSGVYRASLTATNLADYNSWQRFSSLPSGTYNTIVSFGNNVFANHSQPSWGIDTIYQFNGTAWQVAPLDTPQFLHFPVRKIETNGSKLLIASPAGTDIFDLSLNWLGRVNTYNNADAYQAIVDVANTDVTWVADHNNGLVKNYQFWGGTQVFLPNGPNTSQVYELKMSGKDLWVAPGDRSETWVGTYNLAEAYKFTDENWYSIANGAVSAMDTLRDVVCTATDPINPYHNYLGTLGGGVVEINNGYFVKLWNEKNSALQSRGDANYHWVGTYSMNYDTAGNLWIANSYATNPLVVRKKDSTWTNFNFGTLVAYPPIAQVIINQYNQKWMVLARGGGILVFNENGTWNTNDDDKRKLTTGAGNGNLPTNDVECLAEDKDGEIWVGTDKGIAVFYCPDQIFSSSGCDAQQIYIQQDGHTQLLLETEIVTAIAVDGANRKWIGTQNSGVYLMSADGTQQVQHFTVDNSPLLSNEIRSIAINPVTGEIFFGTAEGIISYRNDATEGLEDYGNVYVFPNPVTPEYNGPIAITGLVENADVKITDISGGLVYQTKALGGQAIWYGKNFKGERARTGVYMVFCSNEDGKKTYVAKILLVN